MTSQDREAQRAFTDLIIGGQFDAHLDAIVEACVTRRKVRAVQHSATLQDGDFVRFVKDQDFLGLFGTVDGKGTRRGGATVTVRVDVMGSDGSQFRHRGGRKKPIVHDQKWTVPADWVARVVRTENQADDGMTHEDRDRVLAQLPARIDVEMDTTDGLGGFHEHP